jgi:hypothetical protein
MGITQLLSMVRSFRVQMRVARTEAMLSEQNKILHDSKLARQAQQHFNDRDEKGKEQAMKHRIQSSPDITENYQFQEELQATIAESKDAVERSRWLIENSNKLLDKKRSA